MNNKPIPGTEKKSRRSSHRGIQGILAALLTVAVAVPLLKISLGASAAAKDAVSVGLILSPGETLLAADPCAVNVTSPTVDEGILIAREKQEEERKLREEEERKKQMIPLSSVTKQDTAASFGVALPQSTAVEDGYFEDAVFIGNSLTVGFSYVCDYDADYFCTVGLNVSGYFKDILPSGKTIPQTIREKTGGEAYKKAYLMFGVNELGWSSADVFCEYYEKVIDDVRQACPDAVIYVQSILPMNEQIWTGYETVNNTNVAKFNRCLAEMTTRLDGVYYVNIAELFADENGALPADITTDGVHLVSSAYRQWQEYLRTHTVGNG